MLIGACMPVGQLRRIFTGLCRCISILQILFQVNMRHGHAVSSQAAQLATKCNRM